MSSYVDTVAEAIIQQLKAGAAPWQRPWAAGERYVPYNPTSDKAYRGMNALWLMSRSSERGFTDQRWMTYRQADLQGAQVRRGEKGTVIQYWKWPEQDKAKTEHGGRPVADDGERPDSRLENLERPQVFSAVVFNAEQMDGLSHVEKPSVEQAWESNTRAEAILNASGARILHEGGTRAFYRLTTDTIVLPSREQFASSDGYYATSLHELGHWTGHPTRLARDLSHPFGSEGYAKEELRAEIASLMLGDELGIGHDPAQHVAYVQSWIKALQEDHREIFRAASAAEKIKGYVMGFERTQTQDDVLVQQGAVPAVRPSAEVRTVEERSGDEQSQGMGASQSLALERFYLSVPFREKEEARRAGARWDKAVKSWFVPKDISREGFERWISPREDLTPRLSASEEFAEALRGLGLTLEGPPVMDGTLRRVPVVGDTGSKRSGAYVGFMDAHPAGYMNNFRTGVEMNWKSQRPVVAIDSPTAERLWREAREQQSTRELVRSQLQAAAAARSANLLATAGLAPSDHPYLVKKGLQGNPQALKVDEFGNLLVPAHDIDGRIASLQRISAQGEKSFLKGGRIQGSHCLLGGPIRDSEPLLIAEGYATAATLHRATGLPVVAAFSAGNLLPVAQIYRERLPHIPVIIAGDNDHSKLDLVGVDHVVRKNVGKEKAELAAAEVRGFALLPPFKAQEAGTDWNDFEQLRGAEEMRRAIREGLAVGRLQIHAEAITHVARRDTSELGIHSIEEKRLADRRIIQKDQTAMHEARVSRHDGERVAGTVRLDQAAVHSVEGHAAMDELLERAELVATRQEQKQSIGRRRRM